MYLNTKINISLDVHQESILELMDLILITLIYVFVCISTRFQVHVIYIFRYLPIISGILKYASSMFKYNFSYYIHMYV